MMFLPIGVLSQQLSGDAVPLAPTALTATAISSTEIDLAWTDNADNETGYRIETSANGTSGWSPVASIAADSVSYSVTGLTVETLYYYRVFAVNASGDSAASNVASATTQIAAASYATVVIAEASGDDWEDGAIITITDPTPDTKFIYFADMDTAAHSGLRHQFPFDDTTEYASNSVLNSQVGNVDPDLWPDYHISFNGTASGDTDSGYSRLKTLTGDPADWSLWGNTEGNSTNNSANEDMFFIWESGGATAAASPSHASLPNLTVQLSSYASASLRRNSIIAMYKKNSEYWQIFNGSSYVDTTILTETPVRFWVYHSATKTAIWTDDGYLSSLTRTAAHFSDGVARFIAYSYNNVVREQLIGNHIAGRMTT